VFLLGNPREKSLQKSENRPKNQRKTNLYFLFHLRPSLSIDFPRRWNQFSPESSRVILLSAQNRQQIGNVGSCQPKGFDLEFPLEKLAEFTGLKFMKKSNL
jgi:hypothetical protein